MYYYNIIYIYMSRVLLIASQKTLDGEHMMLLSMLSKIIIKANKI